MLEQMVESANVAGNKRRSYFILSGISVSIAAMALLIFDIYTANFEIGDQGLLSNDLLSPIAVRPLQPEKKTVATRAIRGCSSGYYTPDKSSPNRGIEVRTGRLVGGS
ncbi:MAG: hypothetical protein C4324_11555 [Blastocatellia bacterium]